MKQLLGTVVLALSLSATGVIAQERAGGSDASGSTIGGIATSTIVAGAVGVAVAAAVISNNRSSSVNPDAPVETCNEGDGSPVNGICTGTTLTLSGGTLVPVTYTYPAIVQ
ncbi:hypothetical protein QE250_05830 [Chromatiaceae bacterium AAb-1]|nr:hypothetical protein [Chromatiaceae bacterium AAb-1]